jgi:hypothetical protein
MARSDVDGIDREMDGSRPSRLTRPLPPAAHTVDLAAVSFRRTAGTAVTHGDRGLEAVVAFGWGRAAIIKTLGGSCDINSLRDEFDDVDDPLTLVDACFDVITRSHR